MLTLKAQVTCWYCSKIFKNPIQFPCDDTICREHLSANDVVEQNKIKCKKCNEEFGVENNEFKSNEAIVKLKESQSHLGATQKKHKNELMY